MQSALEFFLNRVWIR